MTFLWAAIKGRDPLDVWVYAVLIAAAFAALVYFVIKLIDRAHAGHKERELEPRGAINDEIPLHIAASEAYGATRGTIVSEMAERGESPQYKINVLTWYATYMAVVFKAPIYGQMRLSPKREQIDMKGFAFATEDEAIIAKETNGNRVWEKITINRADLDKAIEKLKETAREVP
jgi:hypothetical protein